MGLEGAPAVTVTLNLDSDVEKGLLARAKARGISVDAYVQEIVAKESGLNVSAHSRQIHERFESLSDLLLQSPFAGANLDLSRSQDSPRAVDLE
jgi:hypothetical protein